MDEVSNEEKIMKLCIFMPTSLELSEKIEGWKKFVRQEESHNEFYYNRTGTDMRRQPFREEGLVTWYTGVARMWLDSRGDSGFVFCFEGRRVSLWASEVVSKIREIVQGEEVRYHIAEYETTEPTWKWYEMLWDYKERR